MTLEDVYNETVVDYPAFAGEPADDTVKGILRDLIGKQHKYWMMGVDDAHKGSARKGYDIMRRTVVEIMPERSDEVHKKMTELLLNAYNDGYSSVSHMFLSEPDIKPLADR